MTGQLEQHFSDSKAQIWRVRKVVEEAAEQALEYAEKGQPAFGISGFLRKLETNELTAHIITNWRKAFHWLLRVADEYGLQRLEAEMLSLAPAA